MSFVVPSVNVVLYYSEVVLCESVLCVMAGLCLVSPETSAGSFLESPSFFPFSRSSGFAPSSGSGRVSCYQEVICLPLVSVVLFVFSSPL